MEIIVAETAGFCFGVDRAVRRLNEMVQEKKEDHSPIYSYGPVIHNPHVVQGFEEQGVKIVNNLDDTVALPIGHVFIRSHGVSEETITTLEKKGFQVVDSTCPYVKKIHRIVGEASRLGHTIIIIGDKDHPEVVGIAGWTTGDVIIIDEPEAVDIQVWDQEKKYIVVAQTTYHTEKYKVILKKLQKKSIRVIINETICQATRLRQKEALELSEKVTKMIVIGGKNSSNTRKLYEICKRQCKDTYYVETIEDLELNVFKDNDIIGITAGASTPKNIIEEVISNVRNAKF